MDPAPIFNSWLEFFYTAGVALWIALPFVLLPVLSFITAAPYGKFVSDKFGRQMNGKLGWAIQEITSPVVYVLAFWLANQAQSPSYEHDAMMTNHRFLLLALWNIHYFNRSIIYTLRMSSMKPSPVVIVLSAVAFNIVNGYINGYSAAVVAKPQDFISTTTLIGTAIFALGMYGNIVSDNILKNLRQSSSDPGNKKATSSSDGKYYVPHGWLYEYIACPNYFCEIVEWSGYAIASNFAIAPCLFVVMTAANLVPRALTTQKWYREHFKDKYPKNRKAIVPFIL